MTFIRLIFILFYRENYIFSAKGAYAPNPLLQGEPKVPPNPLLQGEPNVFREAPLLLRPKLRDKIINFYNKEGVWGVREAELL